MLPTHSQGTSFLYASNHSTPIKSSPENRITGWCFGRNKAESLNLLDTLKHPDEHDDNKLNAVVQLKALVDPSYQDKFKLRVSPSNSGLIFTWEIHGESKGENLLEGIFNTSTKDFLENFDRLSPEAQNFFKEALLQRHEHIIVAAEHLMNNLDKFEEHEKAAVIGTILTEPTRNPALTLGNIDNFFGPTQEFIVSAFIASPETIKEHARLILDKVHCFRKEERSHIFTVLTKDPAFIHSNPQFFLDNLSQFTPEQQSAILSKQVIESSIASNANLLQKNIAQTITQNARSILENFSHLTETEQLAIGSLLPELYIADQCGLDCEVPPMSPQEKLLSIAVLNFYEPAANHTNGMPPFACNDPAMKLLTYAVYRPGEAPGKPSVPFTGNAIQGIEGLSVLNGDTYDVKSLFNRVGYHTEKDSVIFTVMHPVVCHLMQCNPFFMLNHPFALGVETREEARATMTDRHWRTLNQPTYNDFMANKDKLQPLLEKVYNTHGRSLVVHDTTGSCRNRLG